MCYSYSNHFRVLHSKKKKKITQALSDAEKDAYRKEAKANLQARPKTKKAKSKEATKRPINAYALFVKEHFGDIYENETKEGLTKKEIFKNTVTALSAKYRSEKK